MKWAGVLSVTWVMTSLLMTSYMDERRKKQAVIKIRHPEGNQIS